MTLAPRPTRVRLVVLILLALAPASAYITRNISAFKTTIEGEFAISSERSGDLIAGFALGYFVFQVPGGMLAGRYGTRTVLPIMALAWSACAFLGSLASTAGELHAARIGLGVAQAGLVPCCAKVLGDWIPLAYRGVCGALMNGTMQIGGILATGLSAVLLDHSGWRLLMQVYAQTGVVWAVVFFFYFRNRPEEDPRVNEAERELIGAGRIAPAAAARPLGSWTTVLIVCFSGTLWAYYLQAFFRAYGYEFFLTSCPAYLEKGFELSKKEAGLLATWPMAAFGIGSVLSGVVVDALLVRTGSKWISRCGVAVFGLTACALCFALSTLLRDPRFQIALLSLGCLFASLGSPATWAAGIDIGGRWTPVIFGIMNMAGNIGSYFCPIHTGRLFDFIEKTGASWNLVLWLFATVHVAGAATWVFINPNRPVDPD